MTGPVSAEEEKTENFTCYVNKYFKLTNICNNLASDLKFQL